MSTPAHSIIAPSAAGVWGRPNGCPGYVTAAQLYPEAPGEETQDAKEGGAAHWVGEAAIQHYQGPWVGTPAPAPGDTAPNGVVIDEDMVDAAHLYASDVVAVLRPVQPQPNHYGIEEVVNCSAVHLESYGTPDAWVFDRDRGVLYIWDFKYGRRFVSEYENWQLINYYAGLRDMLGINDQYVTVKMRIVQPRAYGQGGDVREWSVLASELRAHVNILHNNAHEALGPEPTYRSGSHCRYCPARGGRCEAALQGGLALYEAATTHTPAEVTPVDVGRMLDLVERAQEQLEFIATGLTAQAEHYAYNGSNVPGRQLVATHSRLAWTKPIEEVIALGKLLDQDFKKPTEALTPTQVLKLGVDTDLINGYCNTRKTGTKLIKTNINSIKRLFS